MIIDRKDEAGGTDAERGTKDSATDDNSGNSKGHNKKHDCKKKNADEDKKPPVDEEKKNGASEETGENVPEGDKKRIRQGITDLANKKVRAMQRLLCGST
jgi:hypothetical protein